MSAHATRMARAAGVYHPQDIVPGYKLRAARAVCAERERELLAIKGPCSVTTCRLHYAHAGPCDIEADQ